MQKHIYVGMYFYNHKSSAFNNSFESSWWKHFLKYSYVNVFPIGTSSFTEYIFLQYFLILDSRRSLESTRQPRPNDGLRVDISLRPSSYHRCYHRRYHRLGKSQRGKASQRNLTTFFYTRLRLPVWFRLTNGTRCGKVSP